jgi:hypothetical protein
MRSRQWFALAAVMAAAACGPEVSYEHFWPDNAYCTVEDGVTNQGQNVPLFYMGNGVPQGGEYAEVAAQTRLQTFPEREEVAMTPLGFPPRAQIDNGVDGGTYPIGDRYGVVQVVPAAPLSDRWYLVGAITLPKSVAWWPGTRFYRAADGFVGVRFRVGSQPDVLSVRRSDYSGKGTYITVTFSEKVSAISADQPWLEVRSLSDPTLPTAPCRVPSYVMATDDAEATCELLPGNHILQVTVHAFVSADGLQSVPEAAYTSDPSALVTIPDGSRVLYVEPRIN